MLSVSEGMRVSVMFNAAYTLSQRTGPMARKDARSGVRTEQQSSQ